MSRKSQDTRRVPEVKPDSDPDPIDEGPLCGACGQHHPAGRGVCDLDPQSLESLDDASDNEKSLRESLYKLNQAIDPDDVTDKGKARNAHLEHIRDQVWDLGKSLYGWED